MAGESSWDNLINARPHPGPLPRGEGESVPASWYNECVMVHGCNRNFQKLEDRRGPLNCGNLLNSK